MRCHLHHKPAPSLSLPNIRTLIRNFRAKPEPSTVALLLNCDAFYIMCASGTFPSVFFDYNRYIARKEVLFVSLVLDCQLRTTLTTFTHTDSELPHIKYKLKWLATSNCCILAGNLPFAVLLLSECDFHPPVCSHLAYGMWMHMLSICHASSGVNLLLTPINCKMTLYFPYSSSFIKIESNYPYCSIFQHGIGVLVFVTGVWGIL